MWHGDFLVDTEKFGVVSTDVNVEDRYYMVQIFSNPYSMQDVTIIYVNILSCTERDFIQLPFTKLRCVGDFQTPFSKNIAYLFVYKVFDSDISIVIW